MSNTNFPDKGKLGSYKITEHPKIKIFRRVVFHLCGAPFMFMSSPCAHLGTPPALCELLGLGAAYIFIPYHVGTAQALTWKCTSSQLSASLKQVVVKEHTQGPQ